VRDTTISERNLVCGDVYADVELDLISVDHLPTESSRCINEQLHFAGARGTDDCWYFLTSMLSLGFLAMIPKMTKW
jgi:hypothetical protein